MEEKQGNYKLPKTWVWTTIGEITILSSGGTPSRDNPSFYNGDIPWVKSGELNYNIIVDTDEKITTSGLEKSSAKMLPSGTLLIALYGATVGRLAFLGIKAATNQAIASLFTLDSINKKYLYYFLIHNRELLLQKRIGGAQPNISQKILGNFSIPLAPFNEQERIVSKIEELFSVLDKTEEQLENSLEQLKIYKESFLKKAYGGALTEKWRVLQDNLISVSENINSLDVKNLPKIPKEWDYVPLYSLIDLKSKKITPSKESKLKFIGLDSIEPNSMHISTIHDFSNFKSSANCFNKEEILYGRMRPYLNKVWKAEFEGACSGEFLVLKCKPKLLPEYLKYKLHSLDYVSFASERTSGDRPRISYSTMSSYLFPLCSIEEQKEIIKIIEITISNVEKTENWLKESLDKVTILKKTILKKAFDGKLVEQDKNDVSATLELNKIKKELEEYLVVEKEKKRNLTKTITMKEKEKTIIEVLKEKSNPLPSSEVWLNSDKKDDIDEFYAELKKHVESGLIVELPRQGKESFLKLA